MRLGLTAQITGMTTILLILSLASIGASVDHHANQLLQLIGNTTASNTDATAQAALSAFVTQKVAQAKQSIFTTAGLTFLIGSLLSYLLARLIVSPLHRLTDAVGCLSRHDYNFSLGDLVGRQDEIGKLAHCAESVRQIAEGKEKLEKEQGHMLDLTKAGKKELENVMLFQLEGIVEASVDCSQAVIIALKLMQSVRKSATMTQNIATAIEELVASVQTISENACTAANESREADAATSQGVNASVMARKAVETLTTTIGEAGNKVRSLSEVATQIGDVVAQIESIAAQTNLLALNATIEAARAGEAGKGFAIVASEVKQLANQVALATDGIRKQIETLGSEMESTLQSMNSSVAAAEQGREAVDLVTSQLDTIAHKVQTVSSGMQNIAEILSQQTQAANEVSTSTVQISKASETSKDEVTSTLDKLNKTTKLLDARIDSFAEKMGADAIIEVAKSDHIRLLRRITERLSDANDLTPDKFPDHKNCRFGRWYFSVQDPAIKNHPAFIKIDPPHQKFHESGLKILKNHMAAQHEEAMAEIAIATELSKTMLAYLDELSQFVKQERSKKESVA